jgi:hypothetical protein
VAEYVCWDKEDEEEAGIPPRWRTNVQASDAEGAAEEFAASAMDAAEPFECIEVRVRCPGGALTLVEVWVDWEPVFTSYEVTP